VTKRIIIDCDPGIDDAIAILVALGSPALHVEAITAVAGNVPSPVGAANAQRVLALAGRTDVRVACGAEHPLAGPLPVDPFSHGSDGLAETNLPRPDIALDPRSAPELLVELVDAAPRELTIASLGPMTNLATALRLDPKLPSKVAGVVAIAGTFGLNEYGWRNATGDNPTSEWNVYVDPDAARHVLHAGFDLTLIGLDVATHPDNRVSDAAVVALADSGGPGARFVCDAVDFVTARGFGTYCTLIDPLAVAFAARPEAFETDRFAIDIETGGNLTRGQTVIERRTHFRWDELAEVSLVTEVDYSAAVSFVCDAVAHSDSLLASAASAAVRTRTETHT
jgi:inosine-uridine nucleoside N-ribohydrolase